MESEETENPNWKVRADPDANPLTSFGRDSDFTEELIKGICEKKDSTSLATKGGTSNTAIQKEIVKPDVNATVRKKRNTKKKGASAESALATI